MGVLLEHSEAIQEYGQAMSMIDGDAEAGNGLAFVLGSGRSGTTLLYKILCLHPDVAYISNYHRSAAARPFANAICRLVANNIAAKRRYWFREDGGAYFARSMQQKFFPGPVEGEPFYRDFGVPAVDSEGAGLKALGQQFGRIRKGVRAQVFLTKRTANNQRLPAIRTAFPAARYIHIVRDGRAVVRSVVSVDWWLDHPLWWSKMTPRQMIADGADPVWVAAHGWAVIEGLLAGELREVPSRQVLRVQYEALLEDPVGVAGHIWRFLGLSVDERVLSAVQSLMLAPRTEDWDAAWPPEKYQILLQQAGPMLAELGYIAAPRANDRGAS